MASTATTPAPIMPRSDDRVFSPGRGGCAIDPKKTCLLMIEFQNEFTSEGGKLHDAGMKACMEHTQMLAKSSKLAKDLRVLGVKVFHAPITFAADGSDNPNRNMGILAGCDKGKLFVQGTWGAKICDEMAPIEGDVLVRGKKGLSCFPNTTLEAQLKLHGIETIALGGFMANCCVESTMRDACEKGFNVITLTDCVATGSVDAWKGCTTGTYGFFSTPMTASQFAAQVKAAA